MQQINTEVFAQLACAAVLELVLRLTNDGVLQRDDADSVLHNAVDRLPPEYREDARTVIKSLLGNANI